MRDGIGDSSMARVLPASRDAVDHVPHVGPRAGGSIPNPSELIDDLIAGTPDWRGATLAELRKVIRDADPQITEGWKWVTRRKPGTPVWEHSGIVCFINLLRDRVRVVLYQGAALSDARGLFNARLDAIRSRAIDIHEGDELDKGALSALIRAGVVARQDRALQPMDRNWENRLTRASTATTPSSHGRRRGDAGRAVGAATACEVISRPGRVLDIADQRPPGPSASLPASSPALRRVRDRIDRDFAKPLDVATLARDAGMSAAHFSRQFRLAYGGHHMRT
jgi:hypothetical protein